MNINKEIEKMRPLIIDRIKELTNLPEETIIKTELYPFYDMVNRSPDMLLRHASLDQIVHEIIMHNTEFKNFQTNKLF